MTDNDKTTLIRRIQDELNQARGDIARLEEVTQPISPENAIGRVSRMDAMGNKVINDHALRSAQERHSKLETALANADSPDFGLCSFCLTPIPIERFIAIPETDLCMRCASRH